MLTHVAFDHPAKRESNRSIFHSRIFLNKHVRENKKILNPKLPVQRARASRIQHLANKKPLSLPARMHVYTIPSPLSRPCSLFHRSPPHSLQPSRFTLILRRIKASSIGLTQLILDPILNRTQRLVIKASVFRRLVAGLAAVEEGVGIRSVSGRGSDGEGDDCAGGGFGGEGDDCFAGAGGDEG